jgi:hypothetical protein
MSEKVSWITTNWLERIQNPNLDFKCFINKTEFEKVSFDIASNNVAKYLLSLNKPIFVAFSGGYDSEYVVRKLHSLKIEFTPIIVHLESFSYEREYAYKTLRDLKITARILKLSIPDYIKLYYQYSYQTLNTLNSSPLAFYIHEYVKSMNGILVVGDHVGGMVTRTWGKENDWRAISIEQKILNEKNQDGTITTNGGLDYDIVSNQKFYMADFDMYHYSLYPETYYIFFMTTPQIVHSMLNAIQPTDLNWGDYKERVYQLRWRPKLGSHYKQHFISDTFDVDTFAKIRIYLDSNRKHKSNSIHFFGNKEELLNQISD